MEGFRGGGLFSKVELPSLTLEMSNPVLSFLIYIIYFWLCWVFVAAHGLSLVVVSGGYSSLRCAGFSLRWLL